VTAVPESLRPGFSRLYPSTPTGILEGLTVILLLVLLVGLGVRYATAASGNAQQSAARSQIAALAPALDAYYIDHATYAGMTTQSLGLSRRGSTAPPLQLSDLSETGFCVQVQEGDWYAAQNGPHGQIQTGREPLCP
jgi:type II secretory pathway pseudopilin PulG